MGNWLSSKPNYTERTVKLPDDTELLYNDSGPVTRSNDYTTVVVLHGAGFTADGFTPLFDHAHKNNFRIINLNRRHYRGSTPYTDEELDDLKTGRKIFYDRLAMQIAWFLEHLINVEQVPKPNEERTSGGLVLVGWSFGAATALTVLSDPEVIPKSVYETIEPYFLNLVLYDPPYLALGSPDPEHEVYHPWQDAEAGTPEEIIKRFERWVSSYYEHTGAKAPVYDSKGLDFRKGTERYTIKLWTKDQLSKWYDGPACAATDFLALAGEPRLTLKRQADKAMYDEAQIAAFFPRVKLTFIAGEHSGWHNMHAYMISKQRYEEGVARGEKLRPTTFDCIEGTNHFMHYVCPDVLLQHIAKGLKA